MRPRVPPQDKGRASSRQIMGGDCFGGTAARRKVETGSIKIIVKEERRWR
jgi:hypothetical protein